MDSDIEWSTAKENAAGQAVEKRLAHAQDLWCTHVGHRVPAHWAHTLRMRDDKEWQQHATASAHTQMRDALGGFGSAAW